MKSIKLATLGLLAAFAIGSSATLSPADASGDHEVVKPPRTAWTFAGPFGNFDKAQLQRGFKVYREVCANCHSMNLVSFRNLGEPGGPGFSADQVKALAAEYKVKDTDDKGEPVERPARPSDRWPSPYPNAAAAAALHGKAPPDFSVLAKARTYERGFPNFIFDVFTQYQENGPDYISALLKGYEEAPKGTKIENGQNWNKFYPGNIIAMAQPLQDGSVDYTDGTPQTLDQYSKDVVAFMMWAAEPKLEERKRLGLSVMAFLAVFAVLLWYVKKRVWADIHGGPTGSHAH